jgi:hypothetical protein
MEAAKESTGIQPMKRARRRRLLIPILALVVLAFVAAFAWAARGYLSSRHAADQVADRLAAIYGSRVRLDSVNIGTDRSALQGVRLFEEGDEENDPWLVVEEMQVDIGAWALFGDDPAPSRLELNGASVTLRFDSDGHLLTRIPRPTEKNRPLPNLHLSDGTLVLRQTGRPDLIVHGIDAHLEQEDGTFVVRALTNDPHWGAWTATGTIDPATGAGETRLQNPRADLTMAKLRTLPFVSSNVWEEVQAEGTTPVDFTFRFDPAAGSWKYRIVLHPESTWVHVRAIDLRADQVQGEVIIEDGMVTLSDLHGRTADGDIQTSAAMDFRKRPKEMHFRVCVANVDIRRLPKSWRIPLLVVGRLKGEAVLKVLVGGEPRVLTAGGGDGLINNAVPVKLVYEGNHPRFTFSGGPHAPHP